MAPVIPDPGRIRQFETAEAFEAWLSEHHHREPEIWLRVFKKQSGHPSIAIGEALDVVLCWGWIDGIRKAFDDVSYLQRYSPRKARSIWSRINVGHIERLTREGRMTEHGLIEVEKAKADGRWDAAYEGSARMEMPADLLAAIRAEPLAQHTFDGLNANNRFALAFRIGNLRTAAGRERKIAAFVDMLKRGEMIYPQTRPVNSSRSK